MNNQQKILISWVLIALGIAIHSTLEVGESIFFKPLPTEPYSNGVPIAIHIIHIVAMILPMIMAFLTLFYERKGFRIFSLMYAFLLALLNISHVIETFTVRSTNLSQVILLSFVAIINIVLIVLINKWRKEV